MADENGRDGRTVASLDEIPDFARRRRSARSGPRIA